MACFDHGQKSHSHRRAVGRRGQGQDRRPADAAILDRRAVPGRPQRRAHRLRPRPEVRAAPDPVGHPACRRVVRHRQRRRRGSAGAVCGGGRAGGARHRRDRAAVRQRSRAPDPAVSPRARRAVGSAARRTAHRHDLARHRAGLRRQDRPPWHPRDRSGQPGRARRGRPRERQGAQSRHQGHHARLAAGLRPAGRLRRAHAAVGGRRLGDAQRRDGRGPGHHVRGRAGHAARHRPRHVPVCDLVERVGRRRVHRAWACRPRRSAPCSAS